MSDSIGFNCYVNMKIKSGSARFRGYDSFVCLWSDAPAFMEEMLETDAAIEEPVVVEFVQMMMTEVGFEKWCDENEVEWDQRCSIPATPRSNP